LVAASVETSLFPLIILCLYVNIYINKLGIRTLWVIFLPDLKDNNQFCHTNIAIEDGIIIHLLSSMAYIG
jgi:hypothetical protein